MASRVTSFEELVDHAIKQGIEEVSSVIVYENDEELKRFIAVNNAGGPEAYINALFEAQEVYVD